MFMLRHVLESGSERKRTHFQLELGACVWLYALPHPSLSSTYPSPFLPRTPVPSSPLSPSPTQTVGMMSAFKAKLRAAREESRGRADSVADADNLGSGGGAGVEEEEGSGWTCAM